MSTIAMRLNRRIDRSGGPEACWPWSGARTPAGYGVIGRGRRGEGMTTAHRVALELQLGRPLARDEVACHRCDNPPCCNPAHLFLGSAQANVNDKIAKGRARGGVSRGEQNGYAKLTADQVAEIRRRFTGRVGEQATLAREFEVSRSTVHLIVRNLRWLP